mgnify:CR=1 FL=1
MKYLKTPHRFLRHLPVLPFIYPAVVPILLMDIWVEIYHRVSFPFYGVPYVKRSRYVRIDRHKLKYLNILQKINCMYCGYANGVLQYWVRIFAETENYWCSIKHRESGDFVSPSHHMEFLEFGDKEAYIRDYSSKKTRMI